MVLGGLQTRWGFGRHIYYLLETPDSRARLLQASKLNTINTCLITFELLLIKLSIGFFLLRIFGTRRVYRWLVWGIMTFVFVTSVLAIVALLALCRPLRRNWDPNAPGICSSRDVELKIGYINGGWSLQEEWPSTRALLMIWVVASVLSDWALSSVPIMVLWNLQMSMRKKAGIAALMGLGYL